MVDNRLIIVEGVDCSGKSSLIDNLKDLTGYDSIRGSSFEIAELGVDGMYNYMMGLSKLDKPIIIDRYFLSNLVYASLYNKNMLSESHVDNIVNAIKDRSITIHLHAHEDVIRDRMKKRGDEYIDEKDIGSILDKYRVTVDKYKNVLATYEFDTGLYHSIEIASWINREIKRYDMKY